MVKKPVFRVRREQAIQDRVVPFLEERGWLVERIIGVAAQSGLPDLYCFHREHGHRWIDIKVRGACEMTKRQCQKWPLWEAAGLDIFIMYDATEKEYGNLFQPCNWRELWKPRYEQYNRDIRDIFSVFDEE